VFFEDPWEKEVGFICLMNKINKNLAPNVEKGFKVSDIKDLDTMAILKSWIEFYKLMELEKEETTQNSEGDFKHTTAIVESSSGRRLVERPQKEVTNVGKNIYLGSW
jgi:hypothetical protein